MKTDNQPDVTDRQNCPTAVRSSDLLGFSVTTEYAECSVLVFARTRSRAKSVAHGSEWLSNEPYTDLRVKRQPGADHHAAQFGEGYISCENASEQRVLRELGWYQVDHSMTECCECGLHEWSDVPESRLTEFSDIGEMICAGCRKKANAKLRHGGE